MKYLKELLPYIVIVILVIIIRSFIITPVRVKGNSMVPTLLNKEILILNKWQHKYERFDIVVVDYEKTRLVKRVVGLPGEYVEYKDNNLYINNKKVKENFKHAETEDFVMEEIGIDKIPDNYYFVVGDNRNNSKDSRIIGLIPKKDIIGTTKLVLFPFNKFGNVK